MQLVSSQDNTEIAYGRDGDGPPVVLVHGGSATRHSWDALTPPLADDYELVALDRRGRGDSGDGEEYSLEREVADVRAVIDALDDDPILFGHSFGALVALEVARTTTVERLVLYEPALLTGSHREGAVLADRMQERLDAGERREAVELFFREAAGIENLEPLPVGRVAEIAETIVRENRVVERYELDADLEISVPTLLLTGENGPEHLRDGVRTLHERLAQSRLVELSEAGHVGISTAPEQVAQEFRAFADED
ncbi:alpha/beta fold hydrolase [Halorussus halophilus]|uniref:alpha/beta fold hydrolase n=1 Tax=Halorussus halophilus TaxID=2650975 RepID=UPI0013014FE3|nr:alpha/beta hydrolase [Halorussus halophilus]